MVKDGKLNIIKDLVQVLVKNLKNILNKKEVYFEYTENSDDVIDMALIKTLEKKRLEIKSSDCLDTNNSPITSKILYIKK